MVRRQDSRRERQRSISKALKALVHELQPSREYSKQGNLLVDKIFKTLQSHGHPKFCIDRVKIVGSRGKGTAIGDDTDFDLNVFINDLQIPFQDELIPWMKRVILDSLPNFIFEKKTKFSLQFKTWEGGKLYKFDLLPAANLLTAKMRLQAIVDGVDRSSTLQAVAARERMKLFYENESPNWNYLSTSLSEQTVLFLKNKPKDIIQLIKVAKYWDKNIQMQGYIRGRSYLIELIAIHSQKGLKRCGLLWRFIRFLNSMKGFENLEVVFGHHYNRSSIPSEIMEELPLILDPCNQFNNIASGIDLTVMKTYQYCAKITLDAIKDGDIENIEDLFSFGDIGAEELSCCFDMNLKI